MNGFLHRLAAQAMGNTNTLRSAARTPYAAPLSPANSVEPDSQISTLHSVGNEQHIGKNDTAWDPIPSQEQLHVNSHTEIGIQPRTQPRNNEVTPLLPEVFVVQSGTDTESYTKPNPTSGPSSTAKAILRQSNIEKIDSGEPPVLAEGMEMPIQEDKFKTTTNSNDPSPLLPLRNAERPSASNANVATQRGEHGSFDRQGHQGQVEEITEVHVSIGRIEVTAVHDSPPPKRQAPTRAKPLSLDEYLARRGRGT